MDRRSEDGPDMKCP